MTTMSLEEKYKSTMDYLLTKYKDNTYILNRLEYHITTLDSTLEAELKNYEQRLDRTNMLTNKQQLFIQVFLNKHQYYYLSSNNCFYEYNGIHYSVIKEDDILHELLTSISKDKTLMEWKYKTKLNVIKQIKEKNLFTSVPETDTIQHVLNLLYPNIFKTKDEVKYFLTIIGDNILKKSQDLVFLTNPATKKLLTCIDNLAYVTIGNSTIMNNFSTRYHETHPFETCRLIQTNECFSYENFGKNLSLDLLCVAAHYSSRFENSENFILTKANEDLKVYSWFLKKNTKENILEKFCSEYLQKSLFEKSGPTIQIKWKNMHYLWKHFISAYSLPNMIYYNNLKQLLAEKYEYDEETDTFNSVTSKHLPLVSNFIQFWETTVSENIDDEFEVDEICQLFKIWNSSTSCSISEIDTLKILRHFFPTIEIMENKYILGISCSLWNKKNDIMTSLEILKHNTTSKNEMVSFADSYKFYCKTSTASTVSKRYFEKYLLNELSEFIVFENFLQWKS
jgi:hypothetical protein